MDNENITIYSKFQYNEEDKKWYTDNNGRVALCFTCAYDGYCNSKMKYTRCKNYIKRKTNE